MKIQIASDLHLELLSSALGEQALIRPAPGADLLILAGDIAKGTGAVPIFANWPTPVVYVAGNHEFYGRDWADTQNALRTACRETGIHYLERDRIEIDGVRILGATLWTDFQLRGYTQSQVMQEVAMRLNDYYQITTPSGPLRTADTLADHELSRRWLRTELAKPHAGKTVVVTHHAPHPMSIHSRYAGLALNGGFMSDCSELLPRADLWIHGHSHDSSDYQIGRCRVVANPAGYATNGRQAQKLSDLTLENPNFQPNLLIEV